MVILHARGACNDQERIEIKAHLLELFAPMISLMAAFYIGEQRRRDTLDKTTSVGAFICTVLIVSSLSLLPALLMWTQTAVIFIGDMESLKAYGHAMALGALGVYFSTVTRGNRDNAISDSVSRDSTQPPDAATHNSRNLNG